MGLWPSLNNLSYLFPSDQMVTPRWNDPVYPSNFIPRNTPSCLENVSKFPDLFAALAEDGWTDEELEKLAGLNVIRVLKETEEVAKSLKSTSPIDDLIPEAALKDESCRTKNALMN